jgi:hypothetical protein
MATSYKRTAADMEAQERRFISLGLRLAKTYCDVGETHSKPSHRVDRERLAGKAEKELAMIDRRLGANMGLFGTETETLFVRIAELKGRIKVLRQS